MGVLQTPALPLGYVASKFDMEREMGLEPTTFSLARRRSTSELLPHSQTPMPIITEAQVVCTRVTAAHAALCACKDDVGLLRESQFSFRRVALYRRPQISGYRLHQCVPLTPFHPTHQASHRRGREL